MKSTLKNSKQFRLLKETYNVVNDNSCEEYVSYKIQVKILFFYITIIKSSFWDKTYAEKNIENKYTNLYFCLMNAKNY